jgi:hypothetical protein
LIAEGSICLASGSSVKAGLVLNTIPITSFYTAYEWEETKFTAYQTHEKMQTHEEAFLLIDYLRVEKHGSCYLATRIKVPKTIVHQGIKDHRPSSCTIKKESIRR